MTLRQPRTPARASAAPKTMKRTPQPYPPLHPLPPAPPANWPPAQHRNRRRRGKNVPLALVLLTVPAIMTAIVIVLFALGGLMLFASSRALPAVYAGGVPVAGLSQPEAVATIARAWSEQGIALRDGERVFPIDPALLGIALDAEATAANAIRYGRSQGSFLRALIGRVDVAPTLRVNPAVAEQTLLELAPQINVDPINAGVSFIDGALQPRQPSAGRALDVAGTIAPLARDPAAALADGELELVMQPVQPHFTDPTPIMAAASALLGTPLQLRAYDPIADETLLWLLAPEVWLSWLNAEPDDSKPSGLALSLDPAPLRDYLAQRQDEIGAWRYINFDQAVEAVQTALARGATDPFIRLYQRERQHVVQPGETIISIAYNYGIPYPYIQQANGGIETVSIGQTITLPSRDVMLPLPIVPDKRIVVSMREQRVRVFERGALLWDWPASTGIASSPTWPGIYQIISREPNAYAGNWNLWMPNFLGVYRPIPGADFTNGFHGFPTRGGSQLLWTNSLGTRVTYGCILLSTENSRLLYDWAEEGVIVEIQP